MLAARFGFVLVLLGLGVAARASGVLGPSRRDRLTGFVYFVALPALIFGSTHDRPLGEVFSPTLVVGLWAVVGVMVALSLLVHRNVGSASTRSVATVQSYHSNLGFLGLPLVATVFGGLAAAKASVLLGVGSLTQVPATIVLLVTLNGLDVSVRGELRSLLGNPVLLSLAVGLLFAEFGVRVPGAAAIGIGLLSELALPVALLCVGASLDLDRTVMVRAGTSSGVETDGAERADAPHGSAQVDAQHESTSEDAPARRLRAVATGGTLSVVALKLLIMPALAWLVFATLGADQSTLRAGVLMLGMPTAVSTFIYASELGGDGALASRNVLATTVLSAGSLLVLARLLA